MDFYADINKRLTAKPVFTLAARQAQTAAQNDIDAPRDVYSNELEQLLKGMSTRPEADQIDAVRGIAAAWENTMPDQLMRIAYQLHMLVNQQWFGYSHSAYLLNVAEKFGAFAQAHDNHDALGIARAAFRYKSYGVETLRYVIERGIEKGERTPKAQAPARLALAA